MATGTKKELSKCLSGHLDGLGFDRRRIRERIHVSNRCSRAKDISTKRILETDKIEKIFVGSTREGIGMDFCNDEDILQINHAVICKTDYDSINENGKVVFKMVQRGAPPGYTFLKLQIKDDNSEALENLKYALISKKRGTFLSSQLFMTKNDDVFKCGDGIISRSTSYKSPEGPSIPKYVEPNMIEKFLLSKMNLDKKSKDFVRAFPCKADSILDEWSKRERICDWPSLKTIAHVMCLPAHVVPVGQKDSISADLQWRISFTMAEIHLIQAFNNVQTKVFVLMKLIAKHILQPLCKDITSYVVKMVMLWLAEKTPQKKFRQKHLLARLADAIMHLKTAVKNKCLPSYMIPKRNLFAKKISKNQQKLVIEKLNFLLQNGTRLLDCYFDDPQESVVQICDELYLANCIDKVHTCLMVMLTTEQLANYYIKVFKCKSWSYIYIYNLFFIWAPYYYKYGEHGFSDPLSIQLSDQFAISEREEQKKLRQKESHHSPLCITRRKLGTESKISMYIVDKFGLSFEKLVLLFVLLLQALLLFN